MTTRAVLCMLVVTFAAAIGGATSKPPAAGPPPQAADEASAEPLVWFWFKPARFSAASEPPEQAVVFERGLAAVRGMLVDDKPGLRRAEHVLGLAVAARRAASLGINSCGEGEAFRASLFIGSKAESPDAGRNAAGVELERLLVATPPDDGLVVRVLPDGASVDDARSLWPAAPATHGALAELTAHTEAAFGGLAKGEPVFGCFVNLNAIRHEFEGSFADGIGARALRSWRLSNARAVMVHARWLDPADVATRDPSLPLSPALRAQAPKYAGPPLIAIDLTWSSRAEKPGRVHRAPLAVPYWPGTALGSTPPASECLVCLKTDWQLWLQAALNTYGSWLDERALPALIDGAAAWGRGNAASIARVGPALSPWAIVLLGRSGDTPAPLGVMRWLVIVRDGVKSAAVLEDLGRMLDDFKPTREQGGDVWSVGIGKAAEPWFANEVAWGATTLDAAGTPRQAIMGALGATKPGVAAKCVKEWTAKAGR